jgi:hypothetical protein
MNRAAWVNSRALKPLVGIVVGATEFRFCHYAQQRGGTLPGNPVRYAGILSKRGSEGW